MPELSIIIVNWRSFDYLCECLESVYSTSRDIGFEVIVVDNASGGQDADKIAQAFPQVLLVCSDQNLGFARANNVGFNRSSGPYVVFLNPDTKILGSALSTMLAQAKALPDAAIVGCKLLNRDGTVQTSCIQRFPTIVNQVLDIEYLRLRWPQSRLWGIAPLYSDNPLPVEVEVVSGACLMIRRDVFARAGGFSTEYFMYAEDMDLCYRIRQLGWKAYYTGEARVIHYGGGSSKRREGDSWAAVMQRRAMLRFYELMYGRIHAFLFRAAMGCAAAFRLVAFLVFSPLRQRAYDKKLLHADSAKWLGILKWALGLDRLTPDAVSTTSDHSLR